MKLALLLLAVNPGVGGVLARGDKGSAKSTTARALAELLPPHGGQPAPFVTLPLGATEDRVVGTLDLERVLRGEKALQPGLVAEAHGGVLYIDEVNLLADHLVDLLLDVAAMGVNRVQREGVSVEHEARFALVGTMNPEEGSLRPQFLDRFGLCVDVHAPSTPQERAEIVRRRMRFERDPQAFAAEWQAAQQELGSRLEAARARLPQVTLHDALLEEISRLCTEAGVRSLRADLVMHRAACALAALEGRLEVNGEDLLRVAPLVLLHRRAHDAPRPPQPPAPAQEPTPTPPPRSQENSSEAQAPESAERPGPPDAKTAAEEPTVFAAAPLGAARTVQLRDVSGALAGRRSVSREAGGGRTVRAVRDPAPARLAVSATLRHAAERSAAQGTPLTVSADDLHGRVLEGRAGSRVLFVVDASGSMGARARMEAVKGTALALLEDAYTRRDEVGVIAFRGPAAELLLPPTRDLEVARAALERLPTGGRTPLAHALHLAGEVLGRRRHEALLVLLTDGRGNVPLPGGGDPWEQTLAAARKLSGTPALVLDTESGMVRAGRAAEVAAALGAELLTLEALTQEQLTLTLRARR
nr:VWA domain-containing protein [Deinobacterium chartae]